MKESLSVFIVDDDAFCRNLYEQHILNMGYNRIMLFSNGQDCLNQLTEQPDIIFLDYRMEPLDGLELLRKIKRVNPDIYLVIISGQEDAQIAVNALKYGAFDYIIKGDGDLQKIETVLRKIDHVIEVLQQRPQGKLQKLMSFLSAI